jgi:hypothetical protein
MPTKSHMKRLSPRKPYYKFALFALLGVMAVIAIVKFVNFNVSVEIDRGDSAARTKTYKAHNLPCSFNYTTEYSVSEDMGDVLITKEGGHIGLNRSATMGQGESLDEYIANLEKLNHYSIDQKSKIRINNHDAIVGTIKAGNITQKIYIIGNDRQSVYRIFTNDEESVKDLDSVATSLRCSES